MTTIKEYLNEWKESNISNLDLVKFLNEFNNVKFNLTEAQKEEFQFKIEELQSLQKSLVDVNQIYTVKEESLFDMIAVDFKKRLTNYFIKNDNEHLSNVLTEINVNKMHAIFVVSLIKNYRRTLKEEKEIIKYWNLFWDIEDFIKVNLVKDVSKITEKDLKDLIEMLIVIGESSGYIELTKPKILYIVNLNPLLEDTLTHLAFVSHFRLPMICRPNPYTKKGSIIFGGFLTNSSKNVNVSDLIITLSDDVSIEVKDSYLEALNWLQAIKLKINEDYLKRILETDTDLITKGTEVDFKNFSENKIGSSEYQLVYDFLGFLFCCNSYTEIPVFLNWAVDSRGRIYNINNPINFYSQSIFRNAFTFYDKVTTDIKLSENKINTLNEYEKLNLEINQENALIGIDATASVYQIIGGLIYDKEMLKYTNVIKNDSNEKLDIYTYIIDATKKALDYKEIENLYNKCIRTRKMTWYVNAENFAIKIKNLNRKILKTPIMTYAYNQGEESMAEELREKLGDRTDLRPVYTYIIKTLIKTIHKLFPKIKSLRKLFIKIVEDAGVKNNFIEMSNPTVVSHSFRQKYMKNEKTRINVWSKWYKKSYSMYKIKKAETIDLKKNKAALLPNYVQFLDSCILIEVLLQCKNKNIPVIPVHDCFYTTVNNHQIIKDIYKKAYQKIVLEANNLEYLIEINNLNIDKDEKWLKTLLDKKDKEEILKLEKSNNILW